MIFNDNSELPYLTFGPSCIQPASVVHFAVAFRSRRPIRSRTKLEPEKIRETLTKHSEEILPSKFSSENVTRKDSI